MKSFKLVIFIFLSQLMGWAVVTLFDAWDEYGNGPDLILVYCFGFPLIAAAFYFIFRKKILAVCYNPVKSVCVTLLLWLIFDAALSYTIVYLVDNNWWIVSQKRNFYLSLNGIEYLIYGIFMGMFPVIIALLGEGVIAFVRYMEKRRKKAG